MYRTPSQMVSKTHYSEHIGEFVPIDAWGGKAEAYLPPELPLPSPLDVEKLTPLLNEAEDATRRLNALIAEHPSLLRLFARLEGMASCHIEEIHASLESLLRFAAGLMPKMDRVQYVRDIFLYLDAFAHGRLRMKNGFPLCNRLIKEMHGRLLEKEPSKSPGELRQSQCWIGGRIPAEAVYVPPPAEYVVYLMENLEAFIQESNLPPVLIAGIAHAQFEMIHPFLDGNGRVGRMLIPLVLVERGQMEFPVAEASSHFWEHRQQYYARLRALHTHGDWNGWLRFYLEGLRNVAVGQVEVGQSLLRRFQADEKKLTGDEWAKEVFRAMQVHPIATTAFLANQMDVSEPETGLWRLVEKGIINWENDVFTYAKGLQVMKLGERIDRGNAI